MKLIERSDAILEARQTIERARQHLKRRYCGIDDVIDRICEYAAFWLAVPDGITRPIIVSLWGMTGTGKTSIVRMLTRDFLKQPLIEIDLGTFVGDKDFSQEFYRQYSDYSGTPSVILLDEIQNPRTIDERGEEIDRKGLRGMWSLLSDGVVVPNVHLEKDRQIIAIENMMETYDECGGNPPPEVNDADDVSDEPVIEKADECWYMSYDHKRGRWSIDSWKLEEILRSCNINGLEARRSIEQRLDADFRTTLDFLLKLLEKVEVQPVLDYTKCLIFVTGNIDEVYTAAYCMDPDITADELHDHSLKVTVPDIKQALLKRFRPEQVARLGNNHVLYPALGEDDFRGIIRSELDRVKGYYSEHFDVHFDFHHSVEDLVYAEGVFPTQGARPVLATSAALVDGSIPTCLEAITDKYVNVQRLPSECEVLMEADPDGPEMVFYERSDVSDNYVEIARNHLSLSIDNLRNPKYDEEHVTVAVHEAGHIVGSALLGGVVPIKASAFSPNANTGGYMQTSNRDDGRALQTKKKMIALVTKDLCGWAAEKILLGDEMMSPGASGDIDMATETAVKAFKLWGILGPPIKAVRSTSQDEWTLTVSATDEQIIREFIEERQEAALDVVRENQKMLLEISVALLNHSNISAEDIRTILEENGVDFPCIDRRKEIYEGKLGEFGISPPNKLS